MTIEHRNNNFDSLRLVAALMVVVAHSFRLTEGNYAHEPLYVLTGFLDFGRLGVYIFLCISGYVICESLHRDRRILSFISKRLLRIIPGLILACVVSIFVIGACFTSLPLGEYFTTGETYRYFINVSLFRLQFTLPGVFENVTYPGIVNGSLWTLAYEFFFYIILLLVFAGPVKLRLPFVIILLLSLLLAFGVPDISRFYLPWLGLSIVQICDLGILFFCGALMYFVRPRLGERHLWYLLASGIVVFFAGLYISSIKEYLVYFSVPAIIFPIALLPHINLRSLVKSGDYSYGIYIYAFPIQQAIISWCDGAINVWVLCLSACVAAYLAGAVSWRLVELPALRFKSRISAWTSRLSF